MPLTLSFIDIRKKSVVVICVGVPYFESIQKNQIPIEKHYESGNFNVQ